MSTEAEAITGRRITFGSFEVDFDGLQLLRRGARQRLQEQQMNLLLVLLEQPGTLVTREELRQRLWKPGTFVDFDHSLNTAMMRLREVLGDSSDRPLFIETIPRKGYRFVAPIRELQPRPAQASPPAPQDIAPRSTSAQAPASQPGVAPPLAVAPAPPARRGVFVPASMLWLAGTVGLLLLAALPVVLRRSVFPAHAETRPISSIVVLPLENLSGDSNQDYFADGITDQLIASLARISSLRVISRTTAMNFKGTRESLEKIASDLHVDAVVEGTVLRAGDRVRITAELVQVSTDRHLWAETYESPVGDILPLQNRVAGAIATQIRVKLTPQEKRTLASSRPVDPDAFEDYLKGRYYWGKRSESGLDKAIAYFQSATAKDPSYALAYAGLADCYGILGAAIVGTVPTSQVASRAELAARRAVELDPDLAETQTALATVEFNDNWNWPAAEGGFRRAIALNPSDATAHQRYSLYLMAMGRKEESLSEMNTARTLDPQSLSVSFSLGWRLYMAGQYEQAIAQLRDTVEMDPAYLLAHIVLGQSYEQQRRFPEALAELRQAAALSPDSPPVLAALGHLYAVSGNRPQALLQLAQLQALARQRYVSPYYMAILTMGLGERQETLAWLNQGFADRSNNMIFLNVAPQFQDLRTDPGFLELKHRLLLG